MATVTTPNTGLGGPAVTPAATIPLTIRFIDLADIGTALRQGLADFRANPTHLVFLGLIYPIMGLLLGRMASGGGALPLVYPLLGGFALIGPFAATGLYEFSQRRERGLPVSMRNAFDVLRSPRIGAILTLGVGLAVLFLLWLRVAQFIFDNTMHGADVSSIGAFVQDVLTTAAGWRLIVFGTAAGFVFAIIVLTMAAVSFPLLVDRQVGPDRLGTTLEEQSILAVKTSVRAVLHNPRVMLAWGAVVAAGLAMGTATLLVGLAVIMPVLGHATWHLYRRLVAV